MKVENKKIIWAIILMFIIGISVIIISSKLVSAVTFPSDDLVSYYNMDTGTGTTVFDNTPYGNNGVAAGVQWIPGKIGNATNMTGSNSINFSNNLQHSPDFVSLSFWLYISQYLGDGGVFARGDFTNRDWLMYTEATVHLSSNVWANTGNCNAGNIISDLSVGSWHHIVWVYNASGVNAWVDGTFNNSVICNDGILNKTAGKNLTLGFVGGGNFAKISIDELGIWNRTTGLNNSDVASLYNGGAGLANPNAIIPPTLTLNSPANNLVSLNNSLIFNISSSSSLNALTNITLYINNILNETKVITGNSNETIFTKVFSNGNYNWSAKVCNTGICTDSATRFFNITNFVENNQTFNNVTISGALETFILNFSSTGFTSLNLFYNNTLYTPTIMSLGSNNYIATQNINVPVISSQVNKTFFWMLNNGETNSSSNNQTINTFQIDNCGTYTKVLLNYTLYDEDTQVIIPNTENTTTEVSINIFNLDYNQLLSTFSLNTSTNMTKICIGNLGTTGYYIDVVTKYDGGVSYATEYNNIQKQFINSSSKTIEVPLYDLLTTRAQEFLVTFKDSNFIPQGNVLVDVTRFYVGEGIFKSVEVGKTDSNGETLVDLVLGDVIYTFYFKQNGIILAVLDNVLAKCNNIATGDCQITMNAFSSNINTENFNYQNGLAVSQSFNPTTRIITAQFTTNDSATMLVTLNVTKADRFGNTTICTDSLTSSSGTLSCIVPDSFGNATISSNVLYAKKFNMVLSPLF